MLGAAIQARLSPISLQCLRYWPSKDLQPLSACDTDCTHNFWGYAQTRRRVQQAVLCPVHRCATSRPLESATQVDHRHRMPLHGACSAVAGGWPPTAGITRTVSSQLTSHMVLPTAKNRDSHNPYTHAHKLQPHPKLKAQRTCGSTRADWVRNRAILGQFKSCIEIPGSAARESSHETLL